MAILTNQSMTTSTPTADNSWTLVEGSHLMLVTEGTLKDGTPMSLTFDVATNQDAQIIIENS